MRSRSTGWRASAALALVGGAFAAIVGMALHYRRERVVFRLDAAALTYRTATGWPCVSVLARAEARGLRRVWRSVLVRRSGAPGRPAQPPVVVAVWLLDCSPERWERDIEPLLRRWARN